MHPDSALLLKAKQAYYFGTPIMSDVQYDALEDKIRAQDPADPVLALVGAPIPKDKLLQRAPHQIHMGSQEKVNSFEELERWWKNRYKGSEDFHASYKADGGSISLYYQAGRLVQAITRGDGFEGEDITATAALFQGAPVHLSQPLSIGVRCEAVLTLPDWKKADPDQKTNPRNVASGILGRLDGKGAALITALAFDMDTLTPGQKLFETETQKSRFLEDLGFQTAPWEHCAGLDEVRAFFEKTRALREADQLPFWIDGLVVKYEDLGIQSQLGMTDNRPKGQVAWKFVAEKCESVIERVEWQVGHTGAVTPVAHITPVRIGGTTVSKASLANAENIKTLGATLHAKVIVAKAGDIIPVILEVLEANPQTPIEIPSVCPVCSSPLEKRKNVGGTDSVVLFCKNPDCEARTLGAIKRFCKSRDILGLGDSVIAALADSGIVTKVPDLYRLNAKDIENLVINDEKGVRLGLKRAESICAEIAQKGTRMPLAEFLGSFGTRALGVRRATLMLQANPALESFERWFDESLLDEAFAAKAGVPKAGAIICDALKEKEPVIRETLAFVTLEKSEPPKEKSAAAKTFCITGTLPSGKKKKDYAAQLEAAGHILIDEVRQGLDFLVVSDPHGAESSKTKKAKKLGIPLLSEQEMSAYLT
jgi:DNA ligase (NAD+)